MRCEQSSNERMNWRRLTDLLAVVSLSRRCHSLGTCCENGMVDECGLCGGNNSSCSVVGALKARLHPIIEATTEQRRRFSCDVLTSSFEASLSRALRVRGSTQPIISTYFINVAVCLFCLPPRPKVTNHQSPVTDRVESDEGTSLLPF